MTRSACSPWLTPYLSWLIQYSLFDRPLLALELREVPKTKEAQFTLCTPPSLLPQYPYLPPPQLPPTKKKNQADDCCIKKCSGTGVRGSGDRNRRNASLLTLQSKSWENYLESCLIPSLIFWEMHLLIRGMTCLSFPELLLIISAG